MVTSSLLPTDSGPQRGGGTYPEKPEEVMSLGFCAQLCGVWRMFCPLPEAPFLSAGGALPTVPAGGWSTED